MGHHSCCNKQKVKRGLWSPEEDEKLINYISTYGHGCWSSVPRLAGLQRCGKSCRLRWINYLRPDLKRGSFSHHEASLIIELHRVLGNRWAQIAKHLPGRTDNEVKNFWNSSIKKRLISSKNSVFSTPNGSNLYPNNNILNFPNPQIDQIPNFPIIPPTPIQVFDPIQESRFDQQIFNFHANSSSQPLINYSIPFSWPCNNNNNNQNQSLILGFDHSYPNYNPILENQDSSILVIDNKGINEFAQEPLLDEIGGLCGGFCSGNYMDYFESLMTAVPPPPTEVAAETCSDPLVVNPSVESMWGPQI